MKRALLVVLLLGLVVAGSALEKSDFSYVVWYNPLVFEDVSREVKVDVKVDATKGFDAFNVSLQFTGVQKVTSTNNIHLLDAVDSITGETSIWEMRASEPGTYDLSNAFEIVSWDDSVSLQLEEIAESTDQKIIEIRGWTDSAALCEEHNYVGFWGEQENCQVKIVVNNEEYWAERSGLFAVEYELEEGENRIDIRAQDPGGNTNEETVFVTYTPSIGTILEQNIILVVVVLVLIVAGIIGIVVYWRSRQGTKQDIITESLEELRQKQGRLFMDYARRSGMKGGYDEQTGKLLIEVFRQIVKKDLYYGQVFAEKRLAIKEHEPIFRDDRVSPGIRDLLLQQYSKVLEEKKN